GGHGPGHGGGARDPAGAELLLVRHRPAPITYAGPGQVDDRVGAVQDTRVEGPPARVPGRRPLAARRAGTDQPHHLVAVRSQPPDQGRADEAAPAGDEDLHTAMVPAVRPAPVRPRPTP